MINKSIDVSNCPNTLVYLLEKDDTIIYVGQTSKGLGRPLTHKKDKDFDTVHLIYCNEKDLDMIESKQIYKYQPKYNQTPGNVQSLKVLQRTINKYMKNNLNIYKIREAVVACGFNIKYFKNTEFIFSDEFEKIMTKLMPEANYGK